MENNEAYYWIESDNLSFLERMRFSIDYDVEFQMVLFNYFCDKVDEEISVKKLINRIIWNLVCLAPYQKDINLIIDNFINKAKIHSWIADAVKERCECLYLISNGDIWKLGQFISEFEKQVN